MLSRIGIKLLLAGLVITVPARSQDIEELVVTKEGGVYEVQMTFQIAADAEAIIDVLTDFDNPYRLNPDVTEREVIGYQGDATRVRTRLRSCFLFFCRDLDMLQDVTRSADSVEAVIVPERSDFETGSWLWTISAIDDQTSRIVLAASMEPKVMVPPFFRRMLEREVRAIAANLEIEATMSDDVNE